MNTMQFGVFYRYG